MRDETFKQRDPLEASHIANVVVTQSATLGQSATQIEQALREAASFVAPYRDAHAVGEMRSVERLWRALTGNPSSPSGLDDLSLDDFDSIKICEHDQSAWICSRTQLLRAALIMSPDRAWTYAVGMQRSIEWQLGALQIWLFEARLLSTLAWAHVRNPMAIVGWLRAKMIFSRMAKGRQPLFGMWSDMLSAIAWKPLSAKRSLAAWRRALAVAKRHEHTLYEAYILERSAEVAPDAATRAAALSSAKEAYLRFGATEKAKLLA